MMQESDRGAEENIKIVEMDIGDGRGSSKSRYSYSHIHDPEKADNQFSANYHGKTHIPYTKLDHQFQISPSPSALTDMSPRACSGHFEDYSYTTTQSSPQHFSTTGKPDPSSGEAFTFPQTDYAESISHIHHPFFPSYMANTESSRAKVRSQSAPKQRPDAWERQSSTRRRPSIEGRNIPLGVRMQRSSSHVGSTINSYHYPWSLKLDRSAASLKDGSECGSTSTVLTGTNYCRSLVGFEVC